MDINPLQDKYFRQSVTQRVVNWFDFRSRSVGMLAFALNRITAIGLVFYLGLHLVVMSQLFGGASRYASFLALARSPLFLIGDIVLMAGALIHGLNGIRVALLGFGIGVRSQRSEFIFLMAVALILIVCVAVLIFTIG
jgi:succinate dehydrogenase / fumarate reductase cytochrome b subunit